MNATGHMVDSPSNFQQAPKVSKWHSANVASHDNSYYPFKALQHGEEETYEAARDAFKQIFWEWQAWAVRQPGKVTWYG